VSFRHAFAESANMVVDSAIQSSTAKPLCTMQRSIAQLSVHSGFSLCAYERTLVIGLSHRQHLRRERKMDEFIPAYLLREQAAVGALVIFGVLRVVGAAVALSKGWRIGTVEKCFIALAVLYCFPQLFDLLTQSYRVRVAVAEFEGKALGCAIALFCAPILSHRLGFE
jgi:hypothetical protein